MLSYRSSSLGGSPGALGLHEPVAERRLAGSYRLRALPRLVADLAAVAALSRVGSRLRFWRELDLEFARSYHLTAFVEVNALIG
jgi:hypothetical protein